MGDLFCIVRAKTTGEEFKAFLDAPPEVGDAPTWTASGDPRGRGAVPRTARKVRKARGLSL